MKKFLSIILAVCVISTLLVMPAQAGTIIEKQLTPVASGITSNDIAANAANVGDNVVDGDPSTMAIVDGYGRGVYVDLGAEYDITSLDIDLPTANEVTAYVEDNNIAFTDSVSSVNTGAHIRVGGESYGSYLTANSTINGGTRLNTAGQNIGQGKTITYTNLSAVRYIVVTPTASSTPIAVTDIRVKANVEVGATQVVNKQITPNAAGFSGNNFSNSNNVANSLRDGSDATMAIVRGYGNSMYVDLGAVYDVTKIQIVIPAASAVSDFIANAGITEFSSANNSATFIKVGTTVPDTSGNWGTRLNTDSQSVGLGITKTYNNVGEIRYIAIESRGASYPAVASEIKVTANVVEEIVPDPEPEPEPIEATFASSVAFGDADGVETLRFYFTPSFTDEITDFGAYIVPLDLRGEDGETAIVKGNKAIDSGKTFAADLVGIPEAAYGETIVGVPFVVSADGLYTFGSGVEAIVNALK